MYTLTNTTANRIQITSGVHTIGLTNATLNLDRYIGTTITNSNLHSIANETRSVFLAAQARGEITITGTTSGGTWTNDILDTNFNINVTTDGTSLSVVPNVIMSSDDGNLTIRGEVVHFTTEQIQQQAGDDRTRDTA